MSSSEGNPLSYSFNVNNSATPSGNTDSTSPTSTLTALCEDADSGNNHFLLEWSPLSHLFPIIILASNAGEILQASPGYSLLQSLPKQNVSVMSSMDAVSFNGHFSHPSPGYSPLQSFIFLPFQSMIFFE